MRLPTSRKKLLLSMAIPAICSALYMVSPTCAQETPAKPAPPATGNSSGAEYRFVEQGGIRYRETRMNVKQPVRDVHYVDMPQTYYLERYRTDYVNQTSVQQVPRTRYEAVPRLYDWWRVMGVFGEPYVQYGIEPLTTWQSVPRTTRVPVTRREVAQQTRTVKVAVPYVRMVEKQQISRVAVGPATNRSAANTQNTSVANNLPRYPGAPQSRFATQPSFVPVGGNRSGQQGVATNAGRQSINPSEFNPFGGWSVANRQGFGIGSNGLGVNGNDQASQNAALVGQQLSERFGGIARLNGELPRYGTGPQNSGLNATFQATRPNQ